MFLLTLRMKQHQVYIKKKTFVDSCVAEKGYSNRSGNCCINQWRAEQCRDCWEGYIGENCEQPCPDERFGHFCLGLCNCSVNEICDGRLGCLAKRKENSFITPPSLPRDLEYRTVNWKTPVGLVFGLLFIAFILAVIIKFKRKQRKVSNLNQTNVDISTTTTISEVSQVKVSEYPTLLRVPDTDNGIQSEAYSTFNDFKTCSKV